MNANDIDREANVSCVVMPCCGFTFDAGHTDPDGGYTCPLCEPDAAPRPRYLDVRPAANAGDPISRLIDTCDRVLEELSWLTMATDIREGHKNNISAGLKAFRAARKNLQDNMPAQWPPETLMPSRQMARFALQAAVPSEIRRAIREDLIDPMIEAMLDQMLYQGAVAGWRETQKERAVSG